MEELNKLELNLLQGLITKYPSLVSQIGHLKVNKRQLAGFSYYIYLSYQNFAEEPEMINALFSNGEKILIPHLKEGLSYVIDVTAGKIEHIEFSSYKENWDGKIETYEIMGSEQYE